MTLMLCPTAARAMIEDRMESGMDAATIRVERQLPTKISTARPARIAAVTISCTTSSMEARTKFDASLNGLIEMPGGSVLRIWGSLALTPATTARVEASPVFRIWSRIACWPFTMTMFCCGGPPSWT